MFRKTTWWLVAVIIPLAVIVVLTGILIERPAVMSVDEGEVRVSSSGDPGGKVETLSPPEDNFAFKGAPSDSALCADVMTYDHNEVGAGSAGSSALTSQARSAIMAPAGGGAGGAAYGGRFCRRMVAAGGKAPMTKPIHKGYGINPFIETSKSLQSTFALDVDTASYTMARTYLDGGQLPPAEAVRVEEFLNYFKYHDPAPTKEAFEIHLEAGPSRFSKKNALLRIAVRSRDVQKKHRTPAILTFVVDISGSMNQDNRLSLVKQALHLLVNELGEGDKVGIAVYDSTARVALEHTDDKAAILRVVDGLQIGSATNAESGLRAGYTLAAEGFKKGLTNRVILCSDGVANTGLTDATEILKVIEEERARGIFLTTVGFGMGTYNDVIMEQLANKGNGSYHYVDQIKEARRVFVVDLVSTLTTAAVDAKVQVEFDAAVVKRFRLIGYENRHVANENFRNDKVDAGEVGAGHTVTALYEVELQDEESPHRLVQVTMRYREPETQEHVEVRKSISRPQIAKEFTKTSPRFQLASVVAEFAEILRKSEWAKECSMEGVIAAAGKVQDGFDKREDVVELVRLMNKASQLGAKP